MADIDRERKEQEQYERERAERRRLRAERRRIREAQRRRAMIIRGVVFAVLIVALIFVIRAIGKLSSKNKQEEQETASGLEEIEGAEEITEAPEEEAGAEAETAAVETSTGASYMNINEGLPTPSSKQEALKYAASYAAMYDYDNAIAVIQAFAGYDQDEELTGAISNYTSQKSSLVAADVTTIPHVFFHSLLNDDRGLRTDIVGEDRAWRNDAAMTTADEFDHMIQQMYEAGYVLVSLDDMCIKTKNDDGSTSVAPNMSLMLPEGKRPLVMSEDDLSYYHTYGIGTQGYATKMVLDENGAVKCEYTNENGETLIGDYDMVPRLDTFIHEHPDFSYKNARPTVALTGYNGVFGYRTNNYYQDINNEKLDQDQREWLQSHPDFDWDQDVADATAIANAMKKEGWTFASHTYGHWNATTHSAESLQSDNERWMTVNHDIVGDIDKIIFAFGGDIGTVGQYTADNDKFQYFKSQGYVIYCNVDGHAGWTEFGPDYMRTGRVPLDGFAMYQYMTESGNSHSTYKTSFDLLGIHDVDQFFNKYRITPIESE